MIENGCLFYNPIISFYIIDNGEMIVNNIDGNCSSPFLSCTIFVLFKIFSTNSELSVMFSVTDLNLRRPFNRRGESSMSKWLSSIEPLNFIILKLKQPLSVFDLY